MRTAWRQLTVIIPVLLTILLTGWTAGTLPVVYADGGDVQIRLDAEDPALDGQTFTFDLYYVGGFSGTRFVNTEFPGSGADVSIPVPEEYDPQQYDGMRWEEAWAEAAVTLAAEIGGGVFGDPAEKVLQTADVVCGGGAMDLDLEKNGLYLLAGRSRIIGDYRWTPVPCFVGVLNGRVLNQDEIVIKPMREKAVFEHMVIKTWRFPGGREDLAGKTKPQEVLVRICYGGELIDVVSLNDSNNWTYTWKSEESRTPYKYMVRQNGEYVVRKEFEPSDNARWSVSEVLTAEGQFSPAPEDAAKLAYFEAELPLAGETNEADGIERFTIVNTLAHYEEEDGGKPKTGDPSEPGLWAFAAAVSGMLLLLFFARCKKDSGRN